MGPAAAAPPPPLPALLLLLLLLLLRAERPRGAELTVRLPGGARQCFHQDVGRGARLSLDYQVIGGGSGGHVDVDCSVEDPLGRTIYRGAGKQSDSFAHRAEHAGAYRLCFGNELSAFSPKTVYFDVQVGDQAPPGLPGAGSKVTALTQMALACGRIHEALRTVAEAQTLSWRRGAQDGARAEQLLRRVSRWALGEALALGAVGAGQVLLLRGLFARLPAAAPS